MDEKYECPCYGEFTLDCPAGYFEICPNCGWEDDVTKENTQTMVVVPTI